MGQRLHTACTTPACQTRPKCAHLLMSYDESSSDSFDMVQGSVLASAVLPYGWGYAFILPAAIMAACSHHHCPVLSTC